MKSILKARSKLDHLTQQKIEAINNEDYETAQMIKNEMSKIQKTIMSTNDRHNTGISKGRGATLSPIEYRNKGTRKANASQIDSMNAEESYNGAQSQKSLNPLSLKTVRRKDNLPKIENDIFAPKKVIGMEERALPALGRQTPLDFNKVNEDDFEHQKPEQINSSNLTLKVDKKYAPYLDRINGIFGEELAKKVWADKWFFQQEGLQSAVSDLSNTFSSKTEAEKIFIIGFLTDVCCDSDLKTTIGSSKSKQPVKIVKKHVKQMKRRIELYASLVKQTKEIDEKYWNEIFKRLASFIDLNPLKSDFIDLLKSIHSEFGFMSIEQVVHPMTTQQLEQLKEHIHEIKEILSIREEEQKRKRELIIEDK
jgi:hypothetical protein